MRKILAVFLALITCFSLVLVSECHNVSALGGKDIYSYLLVGLDDAAGNTDALSIVSYNAYANHISVIQIPRDTYYEFGFYQNKINQLYPKLISEGKSKEEALAELTDTVGELFGVTLRGYVAATTDSFIGFVDSLGGVKIKIDESFLYLAELEKMGVPLKIGENLLDGKTALKLVRYRSEYIGGDLTRLDVQKLFFAGMFETVYEFVVSDGVCKLFSSAKKNISSDFGVLDIILMAIKHSSKFKMVEFVYLTLPGKAIKSESGLWYYQLNMPALIDVKNDYLMSIDEFDVSKKLIISEEIYNDENIDYKVFHSKINTEKNEK